MPTQGQLNESYEMDSFCVDDDDEIYLGNFFS